MSGSLGEAVLDLSAPIGPLSRDLHQAHGLVQSVMGGIGSSIRRVLEFAIGDLVAGGLRAISNGIRQIGQTAMQAVGRAQVLEKGLQGLLTEQLMYERNADGIYQQTRSFGEASEIAAGQVGELLRFVERLAIASPFETSEVEEVMRLGIAADLSAEKVQAFTAAFLDYAAVHGITSANLSFAADQFLQLRKAGTLTAIDLRQLRRLGIDVSRILGAQLGMSVEQFNEAVKESPELMDALFDAFVQMSTGGAAGAAAAMASTVDGQMATMADVVEMGSRNLFRPIVEALAPVTTGVIGKLSEIATSDKLKEIGQTIGTTLSFGLLAIGNLFQGDDVLAKSNLGQAAETLFGPDAVPAALKLVDAFSQLRAQVVPVLDTLQALAQYFIAVATDGDYLNDWLTHMPEPLARIAEAIGRLVTGDATLLDLFPPEVAATLTAVGQAFSTIAGAIGGAVAAAQSGAGPLGVVKALLLGFNEPGTQVVAFFESLWQKMTALGTEAAPYVLTALTVVGATIQTFVEAVAPHVQHLWETIQMFVANVSERASELGLTWDVVGQAVGKVLAGIGAAILAVIAIVAGLVGAVSEGIAAILEWFDTMAQHVEDVMAAVADFLEAEGALIGEILSGDFQGAIEALGAAWDAWWALVGEILGMFGDALVGALYVAGQTIWGFIETVYDFLGSLFDNIATFDLSAAAGQLIGGLISGMQAKFAEALEAVGSFGEQIAAKLREALGIHSPSTVAFDIGWETGEGLELGAVERIKRMLGQGSALSRIVDAIPDALSPQTAAAGAGPVSIHIDANVANDVDIDRLARRVANEIQRRQA